MVGPFRKKNPGKKKTAVQQFFGQNPKKNEHTKYKTKHAGPQAGNERHVGYTGTGITTFIAS